MIQSGYCRKLLMITSSSNEETSLAAAQALAKIAITSDPSLAFKGELSIEVLRPLVFLLTNGGPLAQFEALMGLTNLAGVDDRLREHIIRLDGLTAIQELQFSTNKMIRRAATEAICNLIYHPVVFSMFMAKNSQLLKIMVALCDDDDFNTKRAASGAIAVISSEPDSIPLLFAASRFEEILLALLNSDNPEILHRSAEIVKNTAKSRKLTSPLQATVSKLKNCSFPLIQQILSQI
jgi:protein unc-45